MPWNFSRFAILLWVLLFCDLLNFQWILKHWKLDLADWPPNCITYTSLFAKSFVLSVKPFSFCLGWSLIKILIYNHAIIRSILNCGRIINRCRDCRTRIITEKRGSTKSNNQHDLDSNYLWSKIFNHRDYELAGILEEKRFLF